MNQSVQKQTILVTGASGFVGGHLVAELAGAGHKVIGVGRETEINNGVAEKLYNYTAIDLTSPDQVMSIDFKPIDTVIHLAGLASVGPSFDNPELYMTVNVESLRNLFESANSQSCFPRLIAISSGAVYGRSDQTITEESPLRPSSPYAKSKIEAEKLLIYYRDHGFSDAINVRPFNHIGPGQAPGFLVPDLGEQLVRSDNPIKAGNLNSSRDYTDVRDVVRAYRMLAEAENLNFDTYNVCSGKSTSGNQIFEMLKVATNRPDAKLEIDQSKLRITDDDVIVGSNQRINKDIGWQPKIALQQTLNDYIKSINS